jgi:hypothetical protein
MGYTISLTVSIVYFFGGIGGFYLSEDNAYQLFRYKDNRSGKLTDLAGS